ncbi:MAG: pyruvate kinase [Bacilli bacterium]|jgi:pyruvate kinase|nr:pyruvate kinase [Bacilli bacterium]
MKRKTKIVCTIGPASESPEMIEKMINAGMNVARLNFSHGSYEEHLNRIKIIREVSARLNRHIGIMADTKGPEIRTGIFENNQAAFKKGQEVLIYKAEINGNSERFHISSPELFSDIEVGDFLLIDDGKMRLDVIETNPQMIKCIVKNSGIIKSRKGVNVPNVKLSMPFISQKDREDLTFAANHGCDFIAASFIRRESDVVAIREILKAANRESMEIIAKIENQEGYDNLEKILMVADGVMVARGDLGVEVSPQLVPIYQKKIIQKANELGKPVITATHMLESMISNPRPTRAEASDVANAILDGSDAIMLSGESAAGDYPIEAVETMDIIAKAIEEIIPYEDRLLRSMKTSQRTNNDAIGIAVAQTALTLENVVAIVAFTETGGTAKRICKFRPSVPIIAVTDNLETCQKLGYYWGVSPILRDNVTDYLAYNRMANEVAKAFGFKPGQTIILTSGWGQTHGTTNSMRIIDIE